MTAHLSRETALKQAWPNFFLVGAAKSGTTSFADYLGQHPCIGFSATKEPNYFLFRDKDLRNMVGPAEPEILFEKLYRWSVTDEAAYSSLFAQTFSSTVRGEASVRYLYYSDVPRRIIASVPDAKIIMILRNPVDRLWSHYLMMRHYYKLEPLSLSQALDAEPERIDAGWDFDWHYVAVGLYAAQVQRYLSTFGSQNVLIIYYDEFLHFPLETARKAFSFLDVDPHFTPRVLKREKASFQPRWPTLDRVSSKISNAKAYQNHIFAFFPVRNFQRLIAKWNRREAPTLSDEMRTRLRSRFTQECRRLEQIVGRQLPPGW